MSKCTNEPRRYVAQVRLNRAELQALQALANMANTTRSNVIRYLINQAVIDQDSGIDWYQDDN